MTMYRVVLLLLTVLTTAVPPSATSSALGDTGARTLLLQECPELKSLERAVENEVAVDRGQQSGGLSPHALLSTLGIGLLSLLCFMPAALLMELIARRRGRLRQERNTCCV